MDIKAAIEIAVNNIAKNGDTDIFTYPFETHIFHDKEMECCNLILEIHNNFEDFLAQYPPSTIDTLTQVGYTGFRWATQIEPFWNAYYLALVISLANEIESSRIPPADGSVFSYRFKWQKDKGKLFSDSTWMSFREKSIELCQEFKYVVVTDIADFYPRIYHHRLENALMRLVPGSATPKRIMKLLNSFSNNVSYGLPIGGPASRILAELALSAADQHLSRRNIRFCRYADDYCIFCDNQAEAYNLLVLLSEKLFNEGLSLQKKKTKIITTAEYTSTAQLLDPANTDDETATDEQKLLNISLRYDPYSETADEDYEFLKEAVNGVDVLGILGREVAKSTIDQTVTKQAIKAIKVLEQDAKVGALKTLLDKDNLIVLSPVFTTIMRSVYASYDDLPQYGKQLIDDSLHEIYNEKSQLLSLDLNVSYYIKSLSKRHNQRKEEILVEIFDKSTKPLIRKSIILVMANWNCHYWLSDLKTEYSGLDDTEKRSFILASYTLGDEGKHWRTHTKRTWTPMQNLIRDWFSSRYSSNTHIPL